MTEKERLVECITCGGNGWIEGDPEWIWCPTCSGAMMYEINTALADTGLEDEDSYMAAFIKAHNAQPRMEHKPKTRYLIQYTTRHSNKRRCYIQVNMEPFIRSTRKAPRSVEDR